MTITSLLIANRGEIARRIVRTARRIGIRTVAVYSDADRHAPHVQEADIAFHIGPAEAAASYLNGTRLIEVAQRAGADAVHPGYGFLSENADFAQACSDAGLRFVGPPADVIRTMGSKIAAKTRAIAVGVPVVPGYNGADQSDATLQAEAADIGYPLLIKASAGGGGRGMRVVERAEDLTAALAGARAEAEAGFGDPALLLERYVRKARHIEVQVLGDAQGNLLHLFERDCSLQRNHQKVIEEAPAPHLPEPLRQAILSSAVTLARAVGYQNAGTVEYLLDDDTGDYFFLEMNTRLQVEHPVTEAITGLDLVEWQLRVAAGEPLGMAQDDVKCTGWAIEARLAAEDPSAGYRPETGRISSYMAAADCRTDSGIQTGTVITHHYDSLLAKVIVQAHERPAAIAKLVTCLSDIRLEGVGTNLGFLTDLLRSGPFAQGTHCTATLGELFPGGWRLPVVTPGLRATAVLARYMADRPVVAGPWQRLGAWRSVSVAGRPGMAIYHLEGEPVEIFETAGGMTVRFSDMQPQIFTHVGTTSTGLVFDQNGQRCDVDVSIDGSAVRLSGDHGRIAVVVETAEEAFLARSDRGTAAAREIRSPMPGLVVELLQSPGAQLSAGDPVIVVEAMKLMQTLVAPCDGVLGDVHFRAGDTVEKQAVLATFIPEETNP
jgi:acetyl/propionyl-CoA carboxylase alpha subunit